MLHIRVGDTLQCYSYLLVSCNFLEQLFPNSVQLWLGIFIKVFIEFVTILFQFFMFWLLWAGGMWVLSFPTRDQTHTPALEGKVLTTGLPGKSPGLEVLFAFYDA